MLSPRSANRFDPEGLHLLNSQLRLCASQEVVKRFWSDSDLCKESFKFRTTDASRLHEFMESSRRAQPRPAADCDLAYQCSIDRANLEFLIGVKILEELTQPPFQLSYVVLDRQRRLFKDEEIS